jgi:MoaA/NifB/PqqE/SkfB family radical SAM enzyme
VSHFYILTSLKWFPKRTITSGLDAINISFDGFTQEVYEKYRRKGDLETVKKNIQLLIDAKRELHSHKPFITLRMVVNKYNENQEDEIRLFSKEIGANLFTAAPLFIDTSNKDQVQNWLPDSQNRSTYDYNENEYENVWNCDDLWEHMIINWDGGTAPCCWLHDAKNDFGNVFIDPIRKIWNGEPYIYSRKVISRKSTAGCSNATICGTCLGHPRYLHE